MKAHINNWVVTLDPRKPYDAPENRVEVLGGEVTGHPDHEDGKALVTSAVQSWDPVQGAVITATGTAYVLGDPHPQYEKNFPGAKARLIKSLQERS